MRIIMNSPISHGNVGRCVYAYNLKDAIPMAAHFTRLMKAATNNWQNTDPTYFDEKGNHASKPPIRKSRKYVRGTTRQALNRALAFKQYGPHFNIRHVVLGKFSHVPTVRRPVQ